MVAITTDLGTEFGLCEYPELPVQHVLPWVRAGGGALNFAVAENCELDDLPQDVDDDGLVEPIGFSRSLPIPGLQRTTNDAFAALIAMTVCKPDCCAGCPLASTGTQGVRRGGRRETIW